ncbi:MAG: hypothetical protein AVDCRST_MAG26-150 [uncultured Chloroflexia bacterium]|uniref:Uncharacterized protein n=1 Tax=uncultured Chloroflexia bacterium TaxID=1672391 RepID=A0A6J4H399_9CHLR|nr:MAG: hypothetical protein AVDCRST_MAG26-150 [uncultured Chloroflexia bacterium]
MVRCAPASQHLRSWLVRTIAHAKQIALPFARLLLLVTPLRLTLQRSGCGNTLFATGKCTRIRIGTEAMDA